MLSTPNYITLSHTVSSYDTNISLSVIYIVKNENNQVIYPYVTDKY